MGATTSTYSEIIKPVAIQPFINTKDAVSFFLMWMRDKGMIKPGSGKEIAWKIRKAGNTSVRKHAEGAATNAAGEQSFASAVLGWAEYDVTMSITSLLKAVNQSGADASFIANIIADESAQGLIDLSQLICDDILGDGTPNAPPQIIGILAGIDDGSVVPNYAGLVRAAAPYMQAYVDDAVADRAVDLSLVDNALDTVQSRPRNANIDVMVCDPFIWRKVGDLMADENKGVRTAIQVFHGFQFILWDGNIPLIKVPGYANDRIDGFETSKLEYHNLLEFDVVEENSAHVDTVVLMHKGQMALKDPYRSFSVRDLDPNL